MSRDELRELLDRALALDADALDEFLAEVRRSHPDLVDELSRRLGAGGEAVGDIVGAAADAWSRSGLPGAGDRLGRYRILRKIGEGGMGTTYLAETDDHAVCVKLLKRGMDTDALLARFRRESEFLAELDHPYIARIVEGASTDDGRPFFVMEYVDGEHIDTFVERRAMSVRERLGLFLRVCEAVQVAHQHLIVHRDLKPANILVTDDGSPKLLDFGLAKLVHPNAGDATTRVTSETRLLTPEYASPEQVLGHRVSTATDVYSLAVLLYRLLTGVLPVSVDELGPAALQRAVVEGSVAPPSTHDRRLRGDLDAIVETGLRKNPRDRYGSVQEFALDIRRHLRGDPIAARRPTVWTRTRSFVRRNPVVTALGVASVVLAVAMSVQSFRVARARDATVRERDHATDVAGLLADVLDVTDPDVTFLEASDPAAANLGTSSFTLSAWVLVDTPSDGVRTILDNREPPYHASRGVHLFLYDDRLGVQVSDGTTGAAPNRVVLGTRSVADARWRHLVAVVDRAGPTGRVDLYIDTERERRFDGAVPTGPLDSSAPLRVGHESDGFHVARPFRGSIAEPRLFDTALDSADVHALFEFDRLSLRAFVPAVPSVWPSPRGEPADVPLVIVAPPGESGAYAWSVGGLASAGVDPATRFDPASGVVDVGPEGWALVPIRVRFSDRPGPFGIEVTVTSRRTGERRRTRGVLVPTGGAGASVPITVVSFEPTRLVFGEVPAGASVRVRAVEGGEDAATVRLEAAADGESGAHVIHPAPCDVPTLHDVELVDATGSAIASMLVLHTCASAAPTPWPRRLPASRPISYTRATRSNAFVSDPSIRVPAASAVEAHLEIADLTGSIVRRQPLGTLDVGQHAIAWDGCDDAGDRCAPGIYTMRVVSSNYVVTRWSDEAGRFRREPSRVIRSRVVRLH